MSEVFTLALSAAELRSSTSMAFLPFLIPALVAGAATVGATVLQNRAAKKNAQQQTQASQQTAADQTKAMKEQAALQFKYDQQSAAQQHKYNLEALAFSQKNPTVIKGEVDYAKMVKDAEAAGFNPLTAMRNGGSAGFSSTSQPSTPLSRQAPTMQATARQVGQRYVAQTASALGAGVAQMGDFIANFDPFRDQQREMETRLVEAQIANLNASTQRTRFGQVPTYSAGRTAVQMGSTVRRGQTFKSIVDALPANAALPQTPTVERPTLTNPLGDLGLPIDKRVSDAEQWEQRYAAPGEWIGGAYVMTRDLMHNAANAGASGIRWIERNVDRAAGWVKSGQLTPGIHRSPNLSLHQAMGHAKPW